MAVYSYALAAGYNIALVSLLNIETITPTSDRPFYPPRAYGYSSPGQRKGRLNGLGFRAGFPVVEWHFSAMTRKQYEYLQSTYCGGWPSLSGLVTVYTTSGSSTYYRYNAVLDLPATLEAPDGGFFAFKELVVKFYHLVKLA